MPLVDMAPQLFSLLFLAQAPAGAAAGSGLPARGLGYDLTTIFIFTIFGIAFVVVTVSVLSRILRPRAVPESEPAKAETYECGEPSIGSSWVRFDIRFYMVALIFLIFDVEVAFLYPWAVIFKTLRQGGMGSFVFLEMFLFIGILLVGLIYCWRKGDLDWVKSLQSHENVRPAAMERAQPAAEAPSRPKAKQPALAR